MPATLQTLRSGATLHPEEIVNFLTSRIVERGGVFDKDADELLCEEQASPDMSVLVNQGYAFIPKSDGSMAYPVRLYDGDATVDISANASGNPRIDAIVLYIDIGATPNTTATDVALLTVVEGTPAASPVAPTAFAIETEIGAANPYIVLANITVGSGATEIENADIDDVRQQVRASQKFDFAKTGDVKMSIKATADEGWILMNDETIGAVGSGADHEGDHFEDLFALLASDFGQTPTAAWGSGGEITVPTMGGKLPVGYKSTDTDYNALAKTGGAKTANLSHEHLGGTHTHSVANHTHSIPELVRVAGDHDNAGFSMGQFYTAASTTGAGGSGSTGAGGTVNTASAGSAAQDIKNPYRVFNFMIKW